MSTPHNKPTPEDVLRATEQWVETAVIGWRLCPFAAPVVRQKTLRYVVSEARDPETVYQELLQEMLRLVEEPEDKIATTLLITPYVFGRLMPFLDFVGIAEAALEAAGLEGILQIASFHPRYLFDGTPREDVSQFAGRSPYPILHLLRESHISQAADGAINTEEIPQINIQTLQKLGKEHVQAVFQSFYDAETNPDKSTHKDKPTGE